MPRVRIIGCIVLSAALTGDPAKAADRELGKHLSEGCITCHRPNAVSAAGVPQITGLPENHFVALLQSYRDKARDNPVMQTVASTLSAEDMSALAAYFNSIKPAPLAKGKK